LLKLVKAEFVRQNLRMSEALRFEFEDGRANSPVVISGPEKVIAEALKCNHVFNSSGKFGDLQIMVPQEVSEEGRTQLAFNTELIDWSDTRRKGAALSGFYGLVKDLSDMAKTGYVEPDPKIMFGAYNKEGSSYVLSAIVSEPDCPADEAALQASQRMSEAACAVEMHGKVIEPKGYRSLMEAKISFAKRAMFLRMLTTRVSSVGITEGQPRRWLFRGSGLEAVEHIYVATAGLLTIARPVLNEDSTSVTIAE